MNYSDLSEKEQRVYTETKSIHDQDSASRNESIAAAMAEAEKQNNPDIDEEEVKQLMFKYIQDNPSAVYPFLVRGAKLSCRMGTHIRKLNLPECHGVYTGEGVHPLIYADDAEGDKNVMYFGHCNGTINASSCAEKIDLEMVTYDEFYEPKNIGTVKRAYKCVPQIIGNIWQKTNHRTRIIKNDLPDIVGNSADSVTQASYMVCIFGGIIEPLTSGQENTETTPSGPPRTEKSESIPNNSTAATFGAATVGAATAGVAAAAVAGENAGSAAPVARPNETKVETGGGAEKNEITTMPGTNEKSNETENIIIAESSGGTTNPVGLNLHKLLLTKNACYISGRTIVPKGIMVHSTGANNPNLKRYVGPDDGLLGKNAYNNHWNQFTPDKREVCVHAFIGKLADGSVATYQTLPWNYRGWHSGRGFKGSKESANGTHISFEICEDDLTDETYFNAAYNQAVLLCQKLCKEFGLDPMADGVIIGHYEGHALGIASNHGDPKNWFPKHKKSMDTFRADVKKLL